MSPNLIILSHDGDAAARSRQEPDALVVQVRTWTLSRRGVSVKVPRMTLAFIVAVAAHPGAIVSQTEMGDLLWGDRADGGPAWLETAIGRQAMDALPALMALGYRLDTHPGRGRSVRCCLGATPLITGDLADHQEQFHGQA